MTRTDHNLEVYPDLRTATWVDFAKVPILCIAHRRAAKNDVHEAELYVDRGLEKGLEHWVFMVIEWDNYCYLW